LDIARVATQPISLADGRKHPISGGNKAAFRRMRAGIGSRASRLSPHSQSPDQSIRIGHRVRRVNDEALRGAGAIEAPMEVARAVRTSRDGGDGGRVPRLLPGRSRRWFHPGSARSESREE